MNGLSAILTKAVAVIAAIVISYMLGHATLGSRVTILETNYVHVKEGIDHLHKKVDKLLERD